MNDLGEDEEKNNQKWDLNYIEKINNSNRSRLR